MSGCMETDKAEEEIPGRWRDVQKLLTRGSPLAHPDFEPSDQVCSSVVVVPTLLTYILFCVYVFRHTGSYVMCVRS